MNRRIVSLFLCLEGVLYGAFLTMDVLRAGTATVPVKYAGVLLCVLFAFWAAGRGGDRLVPIALFLTACADWFLLVQNDYYTVGIVFFLGVQTVYLLRLRAGRSWWLRAGLALLIWLGMYLLHMATPLNLLAGLYFSQLLSNTILAWRQRRRRLFALGLTLFVGCDICVGLFNSGLISPEVYRLVSIGMWLFYLPSQVLIALSALPDKEAAYENK